MRAQSGPAPGNMVELTEGIASISSQLSPAGSPSNRDDVRAFELDKATSCELSFIDP